MVGTCHALVLLATVAALVLLSSLVSLQHSGDRGISTGGGRGTGGGRNGQSDAGFSRSHSLSNFVRIVSQEQLPSVVNIKDQCVMGPLVKYWNGVAEGYSSPLQPFHGLKSPVAERKYIVFQPDLGGWNNIRMALEVVILFALATGRILVMPPNAVLYLLNQNKKWGDNKSSMKDYFDFGKLQLTPGLEVIEMQDFLRLEALPGHLSLPLPDGNIDLAKQPLWDYLEKACYTRLWSPGKTFIAFNISSKSVDKASAMKVIAAEERTNGNSNRWWYDERTSILVDFGTFNATSNETAEGRRALERVNHYKLGVRKLVPYDKELHKHKGHHDNRLLTHFYSFLFFAEEREDRQTKRFMRDRLRYHDVIFCTGDQIINLLMKDDEALDSTRAEPLYSSKPAVPAYVAYHIRRGDFQQKFTRLPAEEIVRLTEHLVPDRANRLLYIATDECNRSFFEPFVRAFKKVVYLSDYEARTNISSLNRNYVGMIEQVVCANAYTFIGTPLSTFTAYITRMRGFLNRTITPEYNNYYSKMQQQMDLHDLKVGATEKRLSTYAGSSAVRINRAGLYNRTFYFMKNHMYHLHLKPRFNFPLWVRDYVDPFVAIDDFTA